MPQNGNFLKNIDFLALFGVLGVKFQFLAVLRHLEGFFEKSEESSQLSANFSLGCFFQGGLDVIKKFSKSTFWNCHIIWSSKICITSLSYLIFCKPIQGHCGRLNCFYKAPKLLIILLWILLASLKCFVIDWAQCPWTGF